MKLSCTLESFIKSAAICGPRIIKVLAFESFERSKKLANKEQSQHQFALNYSHHPTVSKFIRQKASMKGFQNIKLLNCLVIFVFISRQGGVEGKEDAEAWQRVNSTGWMAKGRAER